MKKQIMIFASVILITAAPILVSSSSGYTVQKGDTLSKIARQHGVSLDQLLEVNPDIDNPDLIRVGDIVHIPHSSADQKQNEPSKGDSVVNRLTDTEKQLMAQLVHAEAKGEPYEGKVAVAHVILNRVEDEHFPDTVSEVIYQPGQFQPVANGSINEPPDEESVKAVEEALANRGKNNRSLYFYNPDTSTDTWIFSRQTLEVIGNHVFAE